MFTFQKMFISRKEYSSFKFCSQIQKTKYYFFSNSSHFFLNVRVSIVLISSKNVCFLNFFFTYSINVHNVRFLKFLFSYSIILFSIFVHNFNKCSGIFRMFSFRNFYGISKTVSVFKVYSQIKKNYSCFKKCSLFRTLFTIS